MVDLRNGALVGASIAVMAGTVALAQAPTPQAPVFTAQTSVVQVDASVFDKSGAPVTSLTAADFEVLEDGAPQSIRTVFLVSSDPQVLASAPTAAQGGASLPPRRELKQRVVVFVFDMAHLAADGFKRSRAAVDAFLADDMTPADVVGIVADGRMLNNRLDTDRAALAKAVDALPAPNLSRYAEMRAWPRLMNETEAAAIAASDERNGLPVLDNAVLRACQERPDECGGPGGDEFVRQQIEAKARQIAAEARGDAVNTLQALQVLATGLGRFPGTKQVVVFSDGFYIEDVIARLQALAGEAARDGVRFTTMDTRGLAGQAAATDMMGAAPSSGTHELAGTLNDTQSDTLNSLAVDTGGEFIQRYNDLRQPLARVAREAGTYYVIGYSPSKPFDGSYRKIQVRVKRPDVTVRAREGYVASAPIILAPEERSNASGSEGPLPGPSKGATSAPPNPGTPAPSNLSTPAPSNPRPLEPATAATAAPSNATVLRPGSADRIRTLAAAEKTSSAVAATAPAPAAAQADQLANEGWDFYAKADVEDARDRLAAAVATGAARPWVYYALGQSEFALSHYDAAAKAWEAVRAALPQYQPVYFDLADAYVALDRRDDALLVTRDVITRWPNDPQGYDATGVLLVQRQAFDEAIKMFTLATEVAPGDAVGFLNLGRACHLRYAQTLRHAGIAKFSDAGSLDESDRQRAIAAYQRYISLGGPYADDARRAVAALEWKQ